MQHHLIGGVAVNSKEPEIAKQFPRFLASPETAGAIKKSGMQPVLEHLTSAIINSALHDEALHISDNECLMLYKTCDSCCLKEGNRNEATLCSVGSRAWQLGGVSRSGSRSASSGEEGFRTRRPAKMGSFWRGFPG